MSTLPTRGRRSVLAAHLVLAAVGGAFFLGSFAYPWTNPEDGTTGAAVLPRTAGVLLLIVGLALCRQELRAGSVLEGDGHVAEGTEHDAAQLRGIQRKLVLVTVGMFAAALLIPFLGMLPALALLTLCLTRFVERLRWRTSLAAAVGVFAVSYLLFIVVLRVPLPFGLLDPAVWSAL